MFDIFGVVAAILLACSAPGTSCRVGGTPVTMASLQGSDSAVVSTQPSPEAQALAEIMPKPRIKPVLKRTAAKDLIIGRPVPVNDVPNVIVKPRHKLQMPLFIGIYY